MRILFYQKGPRQDKVVSDSVHVVEVLNNLIETGHTVSFADGKRHCIVGPSIEVNGSRGRRTDPKWERVKTYASTLPIKGGLVISLNLMREIALFLQAFKTALRTRPVVIYRRHSMFHSEYLLSQIIKVPVVIEVNGIVTQEMRTRSEGDALSLWIVDFLERRSFPKTYKYIVVTPNLRNILSKDYRVPGKNIVVIENGANTELFAPVNRSDAVRLLDLDSERTYVGFVGSLRQWQGLDTFISAIALVVKAYPRVTALIVGEGAMDGELRALSETLGISDKVLFIGRVPYGRVPLYVNACDICVAPSSGTMAKDIGRSPLKLCEYLACGKPVVASRILGLEMLEAYDCGFLAEPEDPNALADAICRLLVDPARSRQMGENGRAYVLQNRSWNNVAKKVADVLKVTAEGRGEETRDTLLGLP